MSNTTVDIMGRRAAFLPASALHQLNRAIEALIALVDELAPDCDLEEDDPPGDDAGRGYESADMEPSLGATDAINQEKAWKATASSEIDLEFDGEGVAEADREEDDEPGGDINDEGQMDTFEECGRPCFADAEPSLGATNDVDQELAWRCPERSEDLESDGCDDQLPAAYVTREQSAATAAETGRLMDWLQRRERGEFDGNGRMFRPDEDVRMPDGTRIMGYVR